MSILFLTDFLPPKFSATGQYSYHQAKKYSKKNIKTSIIGISDKKMTFTDENLRIIGIKSIKLIKKSKIKRILWNIDVCIKICNEILKIKKDFKYIVLNGTPQFLIYFVYFLNFYLNKKLIFRTTDFFPETEMIINNNLFLRISLNILLSLTRYIQKKTYKIQFLGYDQKKYLLSKINIKKFQVKRDVCLVNFNEIKKKNDKNYKIIMYSGNLGLAHDYKTFVNGLSLFFSKFPQKKNKIKIWINSTGQKLPDLLNDLKKNEIRFFKTKPIRIDKLDKLLNKADLQMIFLKKEFLSIVMPSKIYCIIKSQTKILYIGPKESDVFYLGKKFCNEDFVHVENDDTISLVNFFEKFI
jgi:hypothetical protein